MKRIVLLALMMLTVGPLYMQNDNLKKESQTQWIYFDVNSNSKYSFKDLPSALGLSIDEVMQFTKTNTDNKGITHNRYQLYYKNVKVEGNEFITHSKNGKVYMANGKTCKGFNLNVQPVINVEQAIEIAKKMAPAKKYMWEDENAENSLKEITHDSGATYYPKPELIITCDDFDNHFSTMYFKLAYRIYISSAIPYNNECLYIDAFSGNIIKKNSTYNGCAPPPICTNINAQTLYSGLKGINVVSTSTPQQYYLSNPCKAGNITTRYNTNQSTGDVTFFLSSPSTIWGTSATEKALAQVHWASDLFYDYLLNTFSRKSYDDNNSPMIAVVNPIINGSRYDDIQKFTEFSFYSMNDQRYFCPDDAVGHEWGHAVSHNICGFNNSGSQESQAIYEGLSDIFGTLFERYAAGTINWYFAEEFGQYCLRDLSAPKNQFCADTYGGLYFNSNKYAKSTVLSHWFYLLCNGGTGQNDFNYTYSVNGIPIDDAAQIIYNSYNYLLSTSEMPEMRTATLVASSDLFGGCSYTTDQVIAAWDAVGLNKNTDCIKVCVSPVSTECDGTTGTVHITATGGTPPYKFSLFELSTTNNADYYTNVISNIPTGVYKIYVSDQPNTCSGESEPFSITAPPAPSYDYTGIISINSPTTTLSDINGDGKITIKGTVYIETNYILTGRTWYFFDDPTIDPSHDQGKPQSGIVVKNGNTLTLDNCKMTNACGMWQGIQVWGNPAIGANLASHGKLIMKNGTVIENAHVGVALYRRFPQQGNINDYGRGILNATTGCKFINNYIGVEFKANTLYDNYSYVNNCEFIFNSPLKDATYAGEATEAFIKINLVKSINVRSCTFTNSYLGYNYDKRVTGIKSLDGGFNLSKISTAGNTFTNLYRGVDIYAAGSLKPFFCNGSIFDNCSEGIRIIGNSSAIISSNTFYLYDSFADSQQGETGIITESTTYPYNINNNTFTKCNSCQGNSLGIYLTDGGTNASQVSNNSFFGLGIANFIIGNNGNSSGGVQLKCNTYTNNFLAVCINPFGGGSIAPQGSSTAPSGNSFPDVCGNSGTYSDILAGTSVTYYESTANTYPVSLGCLSGNVSVTTTTTSINCSSNGGPAQRETPLLLSYSLNDNNNSKKQHIYEMLLNSERESIPEDRDEAIKLLKNWNSNEAKKLLIPILIDSKNLSEATTTLNEIKAETNDDKDFLSVYGILVSLYNQNLFLSDMNNSEQMILHSIAHSKSFYAYAAQTYLVRGGKENFETKIVLPLVLQNQSLNRQVNSDKKTEPILADNIPNPFSESCYLSCYVPEMKTTSSIIVFDINGKRILKFDAKKGDNIFSLNSENIPNGIYYYSLIIDDIVISTKKMVLIK